MFRFLGNSKVDPQKFATRRDEIAAVLEKHSQLRTAYQQETTRAYNAVAEPLRRIDKGDHDEFAKWTDLQITAMRSELGPRRRSMIAALKAFETFERENDLDGLKRELREMHDAEEAQAIAVHRSTGREKSIEFREALFRAAQIERELLSVIQEGERRWPKQNIFQNGRTMLPPGIGSGILNADGPHTVLSRYLEGLAWYDISLVAVGSPAYIKAQWAQKTGQPITSAPQPIQD
jgi:hypothetical protein